MILGAKLGRRLVAAVAFDDEQPILCDSRFVPAGRDEVERSCGRYFDQVISQARPDEIFYYAPTGSHTVTEVLVGVLEAAARRAGIAATRLSKQDVFPSFGTPPPRTRRELRECVSLLLPAVAENNGARQVVVAEAAAAALVGEIRCGLRAP